MLALVLTGLMSTTSLTADSCCSASPASFAFANDPAFVALHLDPLPFTLSAPKGLMITFATEGGPKSSAYEVRSKRTTDRWILLYHEWWGLNDYIKQQADLLQQELDSANVLALDMFDGQVADKPAVAQGLTQAFKQDRGSAITRGALKYIGSNAKVGTLGWCFGGGQSLNGALLAGEQGRACVVYYGMVEVDSTSLQRLHAPVLGIFGSKDAFISPKVVGHFSDEMKKAGRVLTVENYDAGHAFANPSNPGHNKEFTADAWKKTVAFFKDHLTSPH